MTYLPFLLIGAASLVYCVLSFIRGRAPTAGGDAIYREEEPLTFQLYATFYGVVGLIGIGGSLYMMTR